jgi:pimeloyl-ACP methyl ester carboxylesterase
LVKPQHINLNIAGHQLAAVCLNPATIGEPVILLHGITSSVSFWEVNTAAYLLNIGPCYALSLPGHYPAVAPAVFKQNPLNAESIVQVLGDAIFRLVGKTPATLIGHSTGGFAALALAANRPDMARRVVSISGFAQGRWTGILGLYQQAVQLGQPGEAFFKNMFRLLNRYPRLYRQALRFYAADTRVVYASPDLANALLHTYPDYQRLDLDAMLSYFKYMPKIDIIKQLTRIQAPTLVIAGSRDPIVPPSQSERIARLVAGAELAMIKGAGHLPFLERPLEYNQRLSGWLAQNG